MTTCDHGVCSFVACEDCITDLTAERDALKAALVLETEHCGEWATNAAMWAAERDQARARVAELEKKYTELREDYDAETDGRVKARARVEELEQECRDRQGTEDSLVAWNEEQATRIATLEAALREAKEMLIVVNRALPGSMMTTRLEVDETIEAIDAALAGGG